jgi:hypothetical protein
MSSGPWISESVGTSYTIGVGALATDASPATAKTWHAVFAQATQKILEFWKQRT